MLFSDPYKGILVLSFYLASVNISVYPLGPHTSQCSIVSILIMHCDLLSLTTIVEVLRFFQLSSIINSISMTIFVQATSFLSGHFLEV